MRFVLFLFVSFYARKQLLF